MTGLIGKIAGAWLVAILGGLPLWASMGLAAWVFIAISGLPMTTLPQKMAGAMNSFPIVAAPLFILMGNILGAAKITDRIVVFASALIGWVRGGYAHASVLTSMIFAGMVGSAVADAAGSGAIEIRAMKKAGYKPETAAAITAAAATIGPPSSSCRRNGHSRCTTAPRMSTSGNSTSLARCALTAPSSRSRHVSSPSTKPSPVSSSSTA